MKERLKLDDMSLEELNYTLLTDSRANLLVVDDEDIIRLVFEGVFQDSGHQLEFAATASEALRLVEQHEIDLLIVDKNLPDMSGLELANVVRNRQPLAGFLVITGYATFDSALSALRMGALDYLEKPFDDVELLRSKVERAIEHQHLRAENALLAEQLRAASLQLARFQQQEAASAGSADMQIRKAATYLAQAHNQLSTLCAGSKIRRGSLKAVQALLAEAWRSLGGPGGRQAPGQA